MKFREYLNDPKIILVTTAIFVALASMGLLKNGGDLMWYPSQIFSNGQDPYMAYLKAPEKWFMSSVPNYPPAMYILLLPVAQFSFITFKFVWYSVFVLSSILIAWNLINSSQGTLLWVFSIIWINIFLFIGVRVGQLTPFIYLALIFDPKCKNFLTLFLLSLKFSIGLPIIALLIWKKHYFRSIVQLGILHATTIVIFSVVTDSHILGGFGFLNVGPSSKIILKTALGPWDLMSVIMRGGTAAHLSLYTILVVVSNFILGAFLRKKADDRFLVLLGILMSLTFYFHLPYDYMLLAIVALNIRAKFLSALGILSLTIIELLYRVSLIETLGYFVGGRIILVYMVALLIISYLRQRDKFELI